MTATIPVQVTVQPEATALPTRPRRRVLELATIRRRNRRRATWIKSTHPVAGELPMLALVTSFVAAIVVDGTVMGLTVLAVVR